MKVVIIGKRGYDTLEGNIAETLAHMGHEAHVVDIYQDIKWLKWSRSAGYALLQARYDLAVRTWKRLCNRVVALRPDCVIVTYREVVPEAVGELKQRLKDVPVVHLNPDHVSNLARQYILMSTYDAYFSKEPFLVKVMREQYSLSAYYLPESFNPRVHIKPDILKAQAEAADDVDLVVIANLNPYRVKFLEGLLATLRRNINIRIFGNPKPLPWVGPRLRNIHGNKHLVGEEKARAFYGAKVALNTMHPSEFQGVNCRFFEALGSSAFLLTEDRPVISDLAVPDKEVVTFRNVEEAAAKIEYYLDHESERLAIAEAGYRRALRDHTYEKRIGEMMRLLGSPWSAAY